MSSPTAANPPASSLPNLGSLAAILGEPVRWKILAKLSDGEPMAVCELAERYGRTVAGMSKHLAFMRKHRFVESGPGRLYRLAAHLRPAIGQRDLDLGFCVLKKDAL